MDEPNNPEIENGFDILHALNIPGALFTLVILSSLILPLMGVMDLVFGQFVATVFGTSMMVAFPLVALFSFILRKEIDMKGNFVFIIIGSFLSNFLLNWGMGVWELTIMYIFALAFAILIMFVYFVFYEVFYGFVNDRWKIKVWKKNLILLFVTVIPTILVIVGFFVLLNSIGIEYEQVRTFVTDAFNHLL